MNKQKHIPHAEHHKIDCGLRVHLFLATAIIVVFAVIATANWPIGNQRPTQLWMNALLSILVGSTYLVLTNLRVWWRSPPSGSWRKRRPLE